MSGVITFRHVVSHPVLICREYGLRTFWLCVVAATLGQKKTFLSIVMQ